MRSIATWRRHDLYVRQVHVTHPRLEPHAQTAPQHVLQGRGLRFEGVPGIAAPSEEEREREVETLAPWLSSELLGTTEVLVNPRGFRIRDPDVEKDPVAKGAVICGAGDRARCKARRHGTGPNFARISLQKVTDFAIEPLTQSH